MTALLDIRRRPGIQVESKDGGSGDGGGAVEEGVELEIGEIRGPDEGWEIVDDAIVDLLLASALAGDGGGLDPVGAVGRALLLVEKEAVHALGVALERDGAVLEVG